MHRFYFVQPVMRMADEGGDAPSENPELNILETGNADGDVEGKEEDGEGAEDTETETDGEATGESSEEGEEDEKSAKADADEEEPLTRVDYSKLKEALKEHPEVLKALKTQFFREQKFTELFPTVDAANAALEDSQKFEVFKEMVLDGNTDEFVSQLGENIGEFAENLLPSLARLDAKTYERVTTPLIRNVFWQIAEYGKELGGDAGENIINAAKVAHHAVFRNYELGKPEVKQQQRIDPKLEADRREFYNQKYSELSSSLLNDVERTLDSEIEQGLDPTNSLQPGLKKLLIKEIKTELYSRLNADKAHMGRMQALWAREQKEGFKGSYKDSLKSTFLSRAKTLIPVIRKEKRTEVFATQKSKDKALGDKLNNRPRIVPSGGKPATSRKPVSVAEARKRGMTEMDLLS